jgi:hypothetical protein
MVYSGMLVFQRAHMILTRAKPLISQMRTNIYNTLMVIQTKTDNLRFTQSVYAHSTSTLATKHRQLSAAQVTSTTANLCFTANCL